MPLEFDVNIESEEEENPVEDGDTVSNIQKVFQQKFSISENESASLKRRKYITESASSSDFSKIAVGIGNEMQVYDLTATGLSKYIGKNDFGKFDHNVSGIKFLNNTNLLLASTVAGEIHMFDLRCFKKVHTFEGKLTFQLFHFVIVK